MSLNESIVEDAALEWFLFRSAPLNYGGQVGEQCRVAPTLIPAFSQWEKGKEREAVRRLNPEIFSLSFGLLLHLAVAGLTKLLIREVSGAETLFKSL